MKKPLEIAGRYVINNHISLDNIRKNINLCDDVEDNRNNAVWLSKTVRGKRYYFNNVRSAHVDVVLCEKQNENASVLVCEYSKKIGKYDGRKRDRFTFRWFEPQNIHFGYTIVDAVTATKGVYGFTVALGHNTYVYDYIDYEFDSADLVKVFRWQYITYYCHLKLTDAEIDQYAEVWQLGHTFDNIVECNRSASRFLYKLSREAGWRKLTLQEKQKHNVTGAGSWFFADTFARGSVGEYTDVISTVTPETFVSVSERH